MSAQEPEFNPDTMSPGSDFDDPLVPFDVHDSSGRQGMVKLIIGAVLLLALAFIVLKLYQPGVRDRSDPPLITAENTPFKVVPEDREGTQTPDQDKEIFEVMSGRETQPDVVTLPSPEVPIALPSIPTGEQAVTALPPPEDLAPSSSTAPAQNPAPETGTQTAPARQPAPTRPQPTTSNSTWVVQVASLRSQAEADRTYAEIDAKYRSILAPYRSDIRRVDLAEKGIYYRVRVAGFAGRADAAQLCNQLKAAGQACYVTR